MVCGYIMYVRPTWLTPSSGSYSYEAIDLCVEASRYEESGNVEKANILFGKSQKYYKISDSLFVKERKDYEKQFLLKLSMK